MMNQATLNDHLTAMQRVVNRLPREDAEPIEAVMCDIMLMIAAVLADSDEARRALAEARCELTRLYRDVAPSMPPCSASELERMDWPLAWQRGPLTA